MLKYLKSKISDTNPLRLFYHKIRAVTAAIYYRFPSRYLQVIGVTGTKGKTTTTNLVAGVLSEAGYKVGMTSTINFQVGNYRWTNATKMTTLSPFFLQKMLRKMVDEGCTHAVLEVSSHAIIQNRIWGITFDCAVFTNIGEDHLDYHAGMDNYLRTKGLLFERLNRSQRKPRIPKASVLNRDDPNFAFFDQYVVDRQFTYGMSGGDVFASDVSLLPSGTKFVLHVPNNQVEIILKMPGYFNVYNALAAAAVALSNNINVKVLKEALEKASAIPGRYEAIECGQKFNIIVDYAHTHESLRALLEMYKNLTKGKLYTVFGATGGGRDKGKRTKMGAAADRIADYVILTDDDPYEEDEWKIIEDISTGIKRREGDNFWKIPSRSEAIELALSMAQEGDTVVIAGKGAEEIQMIGGISVPWDDREAVRMMLGREHRVAL
jgi:UDP-N-acetylmuramoyl-L-alanyl-D-glutamate--2,6-diaminopimelate ligase